MSTSTQNYDAILQDLREQRAEIDRMIIDVEKLKRFSELRNNVFSNGTPSTAITTPVTTVTAPVKPPAPYSNRAPRTGTVTITAGVEQVLREAGKPLHANELVKRLAKMGKVTNIKSLTSTILQDRKKGVIVSLGMNTFGLAEWGESAASDNAEGVTERTPENENSNADEHDETPRAFYVYDIVNEHALTGISSSDIMAKLSERGVVLEKEYVHPTLSKAKARGKLVLEDGKWYPA